MNSMHKLVTGNSEEYIKTYRYYSSSAKDKEVGEVEKNLIVTTKRIVLESQNNSGFYRDEFLIDFIDRVDSKFYHSKKSKIWIGLMIIGGLLMVGGFFMGGSLDALFAGANFALAGLGLVVFILGILYLIYKRSKQAFSLTLYSSKKFTDFADISGENFIIKPKRSKKGSKNVQVKSKVTPSAVVMLNELNALVVDIKDFNYQIEYGKKMLLESKITAVDFEKHYNFLLDKIASKYK